MSFLISPLGIPAIAEWLLDRLEDLNCSLRYFIMS
ncbi:MAG: CD1845 family protein [Oscillospiraceae bacterium]|nr:CD1845 family protein [Oscillospiraceae bacterium]